MDRTFNPRSAKAPTHPVAAVDVYLSLHNNIVGVGACKEDG
jgi:hypothetical protein